MSIGFPCISTGILPLDIATGIGGFPRGRIIEIYGPKSAGKSVIALHTIVEAQKLGKTCAYIDTENSINPQLAINIGVKIDDLLYVQPNSIEHAVYKMEELIKSEQISVIVVNSVSEHVPQEDLDDETVGFNVSFRTRLISKAIRKFAGSANRNNTIVIFVNHTRESDGIQETATCGRSLALYASMKLHVRCEKQIRNGNEVLGNRIAVTFTKNKVGSPFQTATFDLMFSS